MNELFEKLLKRFSSFLEDEEKKAVEEVTRIEDVSGKKRDINSWLLMWLIEDELAVREDFDFPYVTNIMAGDTGVYAVFTDNSKLYRADFKVDGNDKVTITNTQQVVTKYEPIEEEERMRKKAFVFRDAENKLKFIAISSAATLNRSGEIDSTALFDDFEENFPENNDVYVTLQHLPRAFEFGSVENIFRVGYLFVTYGEIDESTLIGASAEERMGSGDYGISIGFLPTEEPELLKIEDIEIPVYNRGILVEVSFLLEKRAASYHTLIASVGRERDKMKTEEQAKELLGEWLGDGHEDEINDFVDELGLRQREIESPDVIKRETEDVEEEDVEEEDVEEEDIEEEESVDLVIGEEVMEVIVQSVMEKIQPKIDDVVKSNQEVTSAITELRELVDRVSDTIKENEERVVKLERTQEEAVNEALADVPASKSRINVLYRPTQPEASVTKESNDGVSVENNDGSRTIHLKEQSREILDK
jgi:hypothetical protein